MTDERRISTLSFYIPLRQTTKKKTLWHFVPQKYDSRSSSGGRAGHLRCRMICAAQLTWSYARAMVVARSCALSVSPVDNNRRAAVR